MTLSDEEKANLTALAGFTAHKIADFTGDSDTMTPKQLIEATEYFINVLKRGTIASLALASAVQKAVEEETKLGIEMGKNQDLSKLA